jgi:peptidoglycan/xylan/chitin deacetylase (PgdA/CDA1 family)
MRTGAVNRRQTANGEFGEPRNGTLTLRSRTATDGIRSVWRIVATRLTGHLRRQSRLSPSRQNGRRHHTIHVGEVAQSALASIPSFSNHANRRVFVLCYHSIHPVNQHASATPELFDDHVRWLTMHCDVVPFGDVLEHVRRGGGNKPTVAITFDDGYTDNYTEALPILLRYRVPATFFVTTGLIDGDPRVIGRLQRLWDAAPHEISGLSWDQILEMREAGMEIGAHTRSHPNLEHISEDAGMEELSVSKQVLEDRLGQRVTALAYPFGVPRRHFSHRTIKLASSCGYERAAAVLYRRVRITDHALAIPRLAVTGDSIEMLRAKALGKLDFVGLWQEHAPQWATRMISSEGANRVL